MRSAMMSLGMFLALWVFTFNAVALGGTGPKYTVSLARTTDGVLWAGTDGDGLWRSEDNAETWVRDKAYDAIGGECAFCLDADSSGRLWSGTLNHGVCVFNGREWKSYGLEEGFPGSRIFAIDSGNGDDVWIASDGGLVCFSGKSGKWRHWTRAHGLPENEIAAIAADGASGEVLVSCASRGLFSASKKGDYRDWRRFKSQNGHAGGDEMSVRSRLGKSGFPQLVNCISRICGGGVAVGTIDGLEIVNKGVPAVMPVAGYVSAVCGLGNKTLAVAVRGKGVCVYDFKRNTVREIVSSDIAKYPTALLPLDEASCLVSTYGDGISRFCLGASTEIRKQQSKKTKTVLFPRVTKESLVVKPEKRRNNVASGKSNRDVLFYLRDDWETKGDWWGRYGARYAVLCAMMGQYGDNEVIGGDPDEYRVMGHIGPNYRDFDGMRRWVHWLTPDNRNSLWYMYSGARRQSEWDDHGEAYPRNFDGPDLMIRVRVPAGQHDVAFYFFNKDARTGVNVCRDYLIEASLYDKTHTVYDERTRIEHPMIGPNDRILATTRVKDFSCGVYKIFRINEGGEYLFRISRNGSLNAILSGVFISGSVEPEEKEGLPYASTVLYMGGVIYKPQKTAAAEGQSASLKDFLRFTQQIGQVRNGRDYDGVRTRISSLYARIQSSKDDALLENMRWRLLRWLQEDREKYDRYMLLGWTAVQLRDQSKLSREIARHGKNTLEPGDVPAKTQRSWDSLTNWFDKVPPSRRAYVEEPEPGFWRKCIYGVTTLRKPIYDENVRTNNAKHRRRR